MSAHSPTQNLLRRPAGLAVAMAAMAAMVVLARLFPIESLLGAAQMVGMYLLFYGVLAWVPLGMVAVGYAAFLRPRLFPHRGYRIKRKRHRKAKEIGAPSFSPMRVLVYGLILLGVVAVGFVASYLGSIRGHDWFLIGFGLFWLAWIGAAGAACLAELFRRPPRRYGSAPRLTPCVSGPCAQRRDQ